MIFLYFSIQFNHVKSCRKAGSTQTQLVGWVEGNQSRAPPVHLRETHQSRFVISFTCLLRIFLLIACAYMDKSVLWPHLTENVDRNTLLISYSINLAIDRISCTSFASTNFAIAIWVSFEKTERRWKWADRHLKEGVN